MIDTMYYQKIQNDRRNVFFKKKGVNCSQDVVVGVVLLGDPRVLFV